MKLLSKYIFILCIILHFNSNCVAEKIATIDNLQTPDDIAFFNEKGDKCFLDQYEGKTILLVFWATWCSSCVKEMPDLDLLQKDFRKLPFEVIAVSQDFQGISVLKDFFKVHELRHLKIYHDYQNELFKAFAVVGLPTSYLINAEGRIVKSFAGIINWHEAAIRDLILQHIPGNPVVPKNSYKVQDLNKPVKSMTIKKDGPQDSDDKAPAGDAHAPKVKNLEKDLQSQRSKDEVKQQNDENKDEIKNK